MKLSLRNKILVATLSIVGLGLMIGSLVTYVNTTRAMVNQVTADSRRRAASTVTEIEAWTTERRVDVENWASEKLFETAAEDSPDAKTAQTSASAELARLEKFYPYFTTINVVDLKGAYLASSDAQSVGKINISDRAYFRDALKGKSILSDVLLSKVTGKPVVVVATPIRTNGVMAGVMTGVLDLGRFSEKFIDPIKLLDTGYIFVCDQNGTIIAYPDKSKILKLDIKQFDWGQRLLSGSDGVVDYTFEGKQRMAAYNKDASTGWIVGATAPIDEIRAAPREIGFINVLIGIGTLILSGIVVTVVLFLLLRPFYATVGSLEEGASQVAAAAREVSSASQTSAEGASRQAASIEETSASLEELSSMTHRNAENAQKANDLSKQTRVTADKGAHDMETMTAAIGAIKTSSDDISKIIKTIDEIAFQTNILALNAAVEAARTGEAGLGFAVVADEVRNLAQRSAQAAKETAAKIEDSIVKTAQGVEIGSKVERTFNEIVTNARRVDELAAEVASASHEQTQGIGQINKAVGDMDKATQSNAASAEESSAAAEELNAQAETMKSAVADLFALMSGSRKSAGNWKDTSSGAISGMETQTFFKNGTTGTFKSSPNSAESGNGSFHPASR
jgi:methyl-accepting chemotaxis protein